MDNTQKILQKEGGTLTSYVTGFVLSIILTLIPYILVMDHLLTGMVLVAVLLIFAMIQLFVQLFFFLHLGRESKPRWKLGVLISFVSIILIVVIASLWIMQHLNYNMSLIQFNNVMNYGEGF